LEDLGVFKDCRVGEIDGDGRNFDGFDTLEDFLDIENSERFVEFNKFDDLSG
jgi:hypothetical protein